MNRRTKKILLLGPPILVAVLLVIALGGAIVCGLWNWLLPPLFGWPHVTIWQALGLLVLCRILFGGLGRHGYGRSRFRRRWEERYDRMTPEERERFKEAMRGRGCFRSAPAESPQV
ncbi:MAG TPA: hypothetical protein VGE98_05520 [Thermoanaerobaculia bacterium]